MPYINCGSVHALLCVCVLCVVCCVLCVVRGLVWGHAVTQVHLILLTTSFPSALDASHTARRLTSRRCFRIRVRVRRTSTSCACTSRTPSTRRTTSPAPSGRSSSRKCSPPAVLRTGTVPDARTCHCNCNCNCVVRLRHNLRIVDMYTPLPLVLHCVHLTPLPLVLHCIHLTLLPLIWSCICVVYVHVHLTLALALAYCSGRFVRSAVGVEIFSPQTDHSVSSVRSNCKVPVYISSVSVSCSPPVHSSIASLSSPDPLLSLSLSLSFNLLSLCSSSLVFVFSYNYCPSVGALTPPRDVVLRSHSSLFLPAVPRGGLRFGALPFVHSAADPLHCGRRWRPNAHTHAYAHAHTSARTHAYAHAHTSPAAVVRV